MHEHRDRNECIATQHQGPETIRQYSATVFVLTLALGTTSPVILSHKASSAVNTFQRRNAQCP